jgi:hypothetical protein
LGYKLAQDEVAQAQRRFQAGVTTNVEVITAQDALARASDNQISALFRFNMSRAALARATGEIEAMYSKRGDPDHEFLAQVLRRNPAAPKTPPRRTHRNNTSRGANGFET